MGRVEKAWGTGDLKKNEAHKTFSNLDKLYKHKSRYSMCYKPLPFNLSEEAFRRSWKKDASEDPTELFDNKVLMDKINEDVIQFDWDCYSSVTQVYTPSEVSDLFTRCYVDPGKKTAATVAFSKEMVSEETLYKVMMGLGFIPEADARRVAASYWGES